MREFSLKYLCRLTELCVECQVYSCICGASQHCLQTRNKCHKGVARGQSVLPRSQSSTNLLTWVQVFISLSSRGKSSLSLILLPRHCIRWEDKISREIKSQPHHLWANATIRARYGKKKFPKSAQNAHLETDNDGRSNWSFDDLVLDDDGRRWWPRWRTRSPIPILDSLSLGFEDPGLGGGQPGSLGLCPGGRNLGLGLGLELPGSERMQRILIREDILASLTAKKAQKS